MTLPRVNNETRITSGQDSFTVCPVNYTGVKLFVIIVSKRLCTMYYDIMFGGGDDEPPRSRWCSMRSVWCRGGRGTPWTGQGTYTLCTLSIYSGDRLTQEL